MDFEKIILILTIFSGVIFFFDLAKRRALARRGLSHTAYSGFLGYLIENSREFFPILCLVLILKSFVFQVFRVPTESLEPTVMPGDFVFAWEFSYGLHWPVWHTTLWKGGQPHTGDIAIFRWPVNTHVNFVKRVIGVPGDHISYVNKVLSINGHKMSQKFVGHAIASGEGRSWPVDVYEENLAGVSHQIYVRADVPASNFRNLVVPAGSYFMMGDDRDLSDDSRAWGFVPKENFEGRGVRILFNWDFQGHTISWSRIGKKLE